MNDWLRDPFINFERVQREIDELFRDVLTPPRASSGRASFTPHVDIAYQENPPQLVIRADLAGVSIEDIKLELIDGKLAVEGKRILAALSDARYQRLEIPQGRFRRVLELGFSVDAGGIEAVYQDGVLTVSLPISQKELHASTVIDVQVHDE